jgi:hypothetical protein
VQKADSVADLDATLAIIVTTTVVQVYNVVVTVALWEFVDSAALLKEALIVITRLLVICLVLQ